MILLLAENAGSEIIWAIINDRCVIENRINLQMNYITNEKWLEMHVNDVSWKFPFMIDKRIYNSYEFLWNYIFFLTRLIDISGHFL